MNTTIFWRLVWKEYRLQRVFWLSVVVLTGLLAFYVDWAAETPADRLTGLWCLPLGLSGCYALGCLAMLFAGEHDADTYEFQRSLPVGPKRIFAAKMTFGLVSIGAMYAVTLLLAYVLARELPNRFTDHIVLIATIGYFGAELFLWALFFSLLIRRVLVAAILGVAGATATCEVIGSLWNVLSGDLETLPQIIVVSVLVALADIWLGFRWLTGKSPLRLSFLEDRQDANGTATPTEISLRFRKPNRATMFGRLVWHHWRHSKWLIAATFVPLVLLVVQCAALLFWTHHNPVQRQQDIVLTVNIGVTAWFVAACIPLLGICAFLADQRGNSFRFLADRGVPPKYVWLSRQVVVWLLAPLPLIVSAIVLVLMEPGLLREIRNWRAFPVSELPVVVTVGYWCIGGVMLFVFVAVAAGQFSSMLLHSGILSGVLSIALTSVLVAWGVLMGFWNVNWLWSVLPIPIAMLVATRLRAADWLVERRTFRTWLLPGTVVLLPVATILTAVPFYRVHQIPDVDPGIASVDLADLCRPSTAKEKSTLALFEQAKKHYLRSRELEAEDRYFAERERKKILLEGIDPDVCEKNIQKHEENSKVDREKEKQAAIPLLMEASQGPFYQSAAEWSSEKWYSIATIAASASLLVDDAKRLQTGGQLDAALERYLAAMRVAIQVGNYDYDAANGVARQVYAAIPTWAACPNQTPERILDVARQIDALGQKISAWHSLTVQYVRVRRELEGQLGEETKRRLYGLDRIWPYVPGERARALRLLNVLMEAQRKEFESHSSSTYYPMVWSRLNEALQGFLFVRSELLGQLYRDEHCLWMLLPFQSWDISRRHHESTLREHCRAMETIRSATRVVMALEAWKVEHGALPESLDELVKPDPFDPVQQVMQRKQRRQRGGIDTSPESGFDPSPEKRDEPKIVYLDRMPGDPYTYDEPFGYYRDGLKLPFSWKQRMGWPQKDSEGEVAANTPFIWSRGKCVQRTEQILSHDWDNVQKNYHVKKNFQWWLTHDAGQVGPGSSHELLNEYDITSAGWAFPIP